MQAPESFDLDRLREIPDPLAGAAGREAKAPVAPTEPSLTRPQRRVRSLLVLAAAIGWVLLFVAYLGPRSDLFSPWVILPLSLWMIAAAGALVLALSARDRGLPAGVRVIQVILAVIPLCFGVAALVSSTEGEGPFSLKAAAICMHYANLIASGPLLFACLAFRRSFLSAPAWRGAAIGAVCGLAGSIGIHSHCPTSGTLHALLGHGLPIAAGAILGSILGAIRGRV
jgi:hypothetical protein